jgi:hypothetical protein
MKKAESESSEKKISMLSLEFRNPFSSIQNQMRVLVFSEKSVKQE